jgi:fluoroquinolone transport system permease protein
VSEMMETLIKVAINDFRLIFRDNSLKIFLVLPLLTLVVIRYALPYIAEIYEVLQDYIFVIMVLATTQGPTAFGFIYSMVFVDEKDTSVAKVYGILPISKFWFVVFRLIPPFILATLSTFCLLLVEPFYGLPVIPILVYSIVGGLAAPLMTLFVAILSKNKIEAMTWQKLFNLPLLLPVFAFFVPVSFSFLFALFPAFWAYKGFGSLISGGNFGVYLTVGFFYSLTVVALMVRKLIANHFR